MVSFHIIFPAFTIGLAAWLATIEGMRLATGKCLAAEHCWDPVHWVIKEHGWRFERLKSGRAVTVIAAANGS